MNCYGPGPRCYTFLWIWVPFPLISIRASHFYKIHRSGLYFYRFYSPGCNSCRFLQFRTPFLQWFYWFYAYPWYFLHMHREYDSPVKTMSVGRRNMGMGKKVGIQQPLRHPRLAAARFLLIRIPFLQNSIDPDTVSTDYHRSGSNFCRVL